MTPVTISATAMGGLDIRTADGRVAALAVVDDQGHVLDSGPQLAERIWTTALDCYENFLFAEGALRVFVPDASQTEPHAEADK
ncbi:hypothetical protein [Paraburkholderia sp. BR13444]|uniref:hypothetical protein n=1 Tax=Paraburkholderia sp. BR13444 TaxID=3236997 RepID=UPI0034CE70D2